MPDVSKYGSIHDFLKAQAQRAPNALAILAPGRNPLTYSELCIQTEGTVEMLNAMGVGRNDRVAIVLPNGPELAAAFLAVASGGTSAPLNPAYGAKEFDFYLGDLDAKALVIQSGMDSPAISVARTRGTPIIELSPVVEAGAGSFTLVGAERSAAANGGIAQLEDVALVLHTSGTTSRPKVVPLTQRNLCTSAHNIRSAFELGDSDRCLNVMPLFHIHGLVGAILSTLAAGGNVVCTPGFDGSEFFNWVAGFHPTWYTAVPTMHQAILNGASSHHNVIARYPLRFIRSCSAPLPPKTMAALEGLFNAPVLESYGMTEAAHQMTSNPLPPRKRKPGSIGIPTGQEVAIMNETGDLLKTGETGEIVIRGANVTQGYENNPEANKSAFCNGWFRTGDEGFFDEDGYLFLTGRIKEMINRGGEKVAPREIDEAVMEHPAVEQAVTFAVAHATLWEDVATAVVLGAKASATEKEIREWAFARLADYKVPSQVVIVDEVPKGPTGKLQRIGLAEKFMSKLKSPFVAPRNPAEKAVARIWAAVLDMEQVGIYDNFFGLGGDSLLATQVVSRLRAAFRVELPLPTMFRGPTVADQASLIEELLMSEVEGLTEEEARQFLEQRHGF
ncbi:MAG: AMP-binding protein [Thermodesulfobacteriota bacterium]|nr:AMP-binding protein [Thermodesulfobacteriota bacterium]